MKKIIYFFFAYFSSITCVTCEGSETKPDYSRELRDLLKIKDEAEFKKRYNSSKKTLEEAKELLLETIFNLTPKWHQFEEKAKAKINEFKLKPLSFTWLDTLVSRGLFKEGYFSLDVFNCIFCISSLNTSLSNDDEGSKKFSFKGSFERAIEAFSDEQRKNIIIDFLSQDGLKDSIHKTLDQEVIWVRSLRKNTPPITYKVYQKAEPFLIHSYRKRAIKADYDIIYDIREKPLEKQKIENAWKEFLSVQRTITDEEKKRVKALLGKELHIEAIELLAEASVAVVYKVKIKDKWYAVKVIKEGIEKAIKDNIANYEKVNIPEEEKKLLKALQEKALTEINLTQERKNIKEGQQVYQGAEGVHVVSLAAIDNESTKPGEILVMDFIEGQPLFDYLSAIERKFAEIDRKKPDLEFIRQIANELNQVRGYIENLTYLFFKKLYFEKNSFVHADLHIGNILVHNKTKELYMLDFGFVGRSLDKKYKVDSANIYYKSNNEEFYRKDERGYKIKETFPDKEEVTLREMLYELRKLFKRWANTHEYTQKFDKNYVADITKNIAFCITPALIAEKAELSAQQGKGQKAQLDEWEERCQDIYDYFEKIHKKNMKEHVTVRKLLSISFTKK